MPPVCYPSEGCGREQQRAWLGIFTEGIATATQWRSSGALELTLCEHVEEQLKVSVAVPLLNEPPILEVLTQNVDLAHTYVFYTECST
jgi:hypothetical protein